MLFTRTIRLQNPYRTEAFKKLHSKWMKKLEERDFEDIETPRGEIKDHKTLSDLQQRVQFRSGIIEITLSYFDWASEMVHKGKFKSGVDRKIWKLHADGKTGSEISEKVKLERTWVNRKIQKIAKYLKA